MFLLIETPRYMYYLLLDGPKAFGAVAECSCLEVVLCNTWVGESDIVAPPPPTGSPVGWGCSSYYSSYQKNGRACAREETTHY